MIRDAEFAHDLGVALLVVGVSGLVSMACGMMTAWVVRVAARGGLHPPFAGAWPPDDPIPSDTPCRVVGGDREGAEVVVCWPGDVPGHYFVEFKPGLFQPEGYGMVAAQHMERLAKDSEACERS